MSISEACTELKLSYIKNNYKQISNEARVNDTSYEDYLLELLKGESEQRKINAIKRRINEAHFPNKILLEEFKRDHLNVSIRQKIKQLKTLDFIDNKENIVLIGNPGTGKTALSIALGMKACLDNKRVLFISVPNLMIELKEAMSRNQITKYKRRIEKYDLVIFDELGYVTFDQESGEILFNLLSNRNDAGSIIITSNLTFDRWNEVFKDKVLTGAIVDRLAYKSHLMDMTGDSYRIKATKEWQGENEHE